MPEYTVTFTRDVIQIGTLLIEGDTPAEALENAKKIGLHHVGEQVVWEDDLAGLAYAIAVSEESLDG